MSDLSDLLDGMGVGSPTSAAPPAKPSDLENFLNSVGHAAAVTGSAIVRGAASTPGYLVDVLGSIAASADPHATYSGVDPSKMVGRAIGGEGLATTTTDRTVTQAIHAPEPRNDLERYLQAAGMGVGGMALGGEASLPTLVTGAVSGVSGEAAHQVFPNSNVAPAIAALLAGGVTSATMHPTATSPIKAGMSHPDFNALANEVIPALEGGGTLEHPKTNPTSGAFGPMQVTPETLKDPGYGIKPWDGTVEDAVRIGQQKLGALLHKYDGDGDKTLAAYNWGEGNLDHAIHEFGAEWLNHIPEETFNYVHKGQRMLGGTDTFGSTGGNVPSMDPADLEAAMGGPDDEAILDEIGQKPELVVDNDNKPGDISPESITISKLLDDHISEAGHMLDAFKNDGEHPNTPEQVEAFRQGAEDLKNSLPEDHPLIGKAQDAIDMWHEVQAKIDDEGYAQKPDINELTPRGSDKFLGQEPIEAEPANEAGTKQDAITRQLYTYLTGKDAPPNPSMQDMLGAARDKLASNADEPRTATDRAIDKGFGSGEPPSGGRGGGTGMGGDFSSGGEEPPSEGEPKYADSVNLNRIKISQDAKQLIKDQLLPANTDIETHEENKVKAMSYIDRHGVDNILSGFHKVAPDELSAYQTAVRALSSASKQNVVDLAKALPDEANRTPAQAETLRNAIEMSGRATTLDNAVAKQLGRSMSARRIYMGGNSELSKLLNGAHLDDTSLNKLVEKINAMPDQAGDIAADAMKPGWLEYVKSAYYGISLLSRLSTPIGIFASVSVSHLTEALVHSIAHIVTNPMEPHAWGSWAEGWAKGFKDVPANVKQAWQQSIPTDKASLIQSRVALPGVLGFPSKLIASVDEFFGTLGRSAKAYSDAAQRAYSEGFRGDKFTARMNELVKNATPEEQKIVEDYGKFARLQDSPTPLGRLFKAAVNSKNPAINVTATIMFPFVNIADRLMMYSIRMTPGLSFTDRLTQKDFASSPTGKAVVINRQLIGAGLAAYAVNQVLNGNITGQGPGDPAKKSQWLANHQADSIKINGKWVSYERLPFAGLMSAAATATERYQETGNGKGYMKAIEGMFIGASSGMLHSHYLEGAANLADTMSSGSPDKLADFVGKTVRSFIPGIEQSANEALVDTTVRDTKGNPMLDNIKAGLVGESNTLPAKHDVYGRNEHYEGGAARLVNPFPTKTISKDPTINTLDEVNASTSKSVVTPAAKTIHVNGQAVKLSEQGYQKYQALSGQLFRQAMAGNNLSGMSTEDRLKFVKETMRDARSQAKSQLWGI